MRKVQSDMAVRRASGSTPLVSASWKTRDSASPATAAQSCSRYYVGAAGEGPDVVDDGLTAAAVAAAVTNATP
jgi:hypothetical protein